MKIESRKIGDLIIGDLIIEESLYISGTLTILQNQSNLYGIYENLSGQCRFSYNLSLLSYKTKKVIGYIYKVGYTENKSKVFLEAEILGQANITDSIFEDEIKFYIRWNSDSNKNFDLGVLYIGNKTYENTILVKATIDKQHETNNQK